MADIGRDWSLILNEALSELRSLDLRELRQRTAPLQSALRLQFCTPRSAVTTTLVTLTLPRHPLILHASTQW